MAWDERYRMLKKGEIIQEGDEVDACSDGWKDDPVWKPARCIGEPAPDSQYPSHRVYRRANIPICVKANNCMDCGKLQNDQHERRKDAPLSKMP
jgi:hypothetical protein